MAAVAWLKGPQPEFDFFSFEEAERFLDAADPEWRPMFTLALRTGLRIGELRALRWDDVDLVAGRLVVRRCDWRGHLIRGHHTQFLMPNRRRRLRRFLDEQV